MTLPTELMGVFQLRMPMAWQRKDRVEDVVSPFLRDSSGFEIVPELAPRASEAILDKLSLSAFEGTPLEFALRDAQVTAFAIAGVAMQVGLEPTARHGADLGLIPIVVTDACGAGNHAAAKRSLDALATAGAAQSPPRRGGEPRERRTDAQRSPAVAVTDRIAAAEPCSLAGRERSAKRKHSPKGRPTRCSASPVGPVSASRVG